MQWLEIIQVRSVGTGRAEFQEQFRMLILENARCCEQGVDIKLFQHSSVTSDFSIFICHDSNSTEKRGSEFGIRLAWMLKEYGYVDHTVWQKA